MLITVLLVLLLLLLFVVAFWLLWQFRQARHLHQDCVDLCRSVATELSQRQDEAQVLERMFALAVKHSRAVVALLVYRDGMQGLRVLQSSGVPEPALKRGLHLSAEEVGYGFGGRLTLQPTGGIYQEGLRQAVQEDLGLRLVERQNMLAIPIGVEGDTHGLLQLISPPGHPYTPQYFRSLRGLGIYLDAAIQNARKVVEIQRERDAAQRLYHIGLMISRATELDEIVSCVVKETRRLVEVELTWFLQVDEAQHEKRPLQAVTATSLPAELLPVEIEWEEIQAQLLPTGDFAADNKNYRMLGDIPGMDLPMDTALARLSALGIRSGLTVAVGAGEQMYGVLCSFSRQPQHFGTFEISLQQRIANHLHIALNTFDYHQKLRQLELADERQRISAELHDNMAQVISGMTLELHAFMGLVERGAGREKLLQRLDAIRPMLESANATIRSGIFELRLSPDAEIWENLKRYVEQFEHWFDFQVHIELPAAVPKLSLQAQRELIRMVQEGLWNIKKHSGTREAWLSIEPQQHPRGFKLRIQDQGRGADVQCLQRGQGMATLQDRVQRLNGHMLVETGPGEGFALILQLPFALGARADGR